MLKAKLFLSVILSKAALTDPGDSTVRATGSISKNENKVVTACSFAGSKLVRDLKSLGKFFLKMDRSEKPTFEIIAIFAANVVNSLLIVATFNCENKICMYCIKYKWLNAIKYEYDRQERKETSINIVYTPAPTWMHRRLHR